MVIKRTSTTSKKTSGGTLSSKGSADLQAMIAKKAYEIYVKRGYSHGNDQRDWYEAEKAVRSSLR